MQPLPRPRGPMTGPLPAHLQVPSDPAQLAAVQARLAGRYPLAAFSEARRRLDPSNILGGPLVDALLPRAAAAVPQH